MNVSLTRSSSEYTPNTTFNAVVWKFAFTITFVAVSIHSHWSLKYTST